MMLVARYPRASGGTLVRAFTRSLASRTSGSRINRAATDSPGCRPSAAADREYSTDNVEPRDAAGSTPGRHTPTHTTIPPLPERSRPGRSRPRTSSSQADDSSAVQIRSWALTRFPGNHE